MFDKLVRGEVLEPATLSKARGVLAEVVDPFEAFPHADGSEFRARVRRFGGRGIHRRPTS